MNLNIISTSGWWKIKYDFDLLLMLSDLLLNISTIDKKLFVTNNLNLLALSRIQKFGFELNFLIVYQIDDRVERFSNDVELESNI